MDSPQEPLEGTLHFFFNFTFYNIFNATKSMQCEQNPGQSDMSYLCPQNESRHSIRKQKHKNNFNVSALIFLAFSLLKSISDFPHLELQENRSVLSQATLW